MEKKMWWVAHPRCPETHTRTRTCMHGTGTEREQRRDGRWCFSTFSDVMRNHIAQPKPLYSVDGGEE